MDRVGYFAPSGNLFIGIRTRLPNVAGALAGHRRRLGDDQDPVRSALQVHPYSRQLCMSSGGAIVGRQG